MLQKSNFLQLHRKNQPLIPLNAWDLIYQGDFTVRLSIIKETDKKASLFIYARLDEFFQGAIARSNQDLQLLKKAIQLRKAYVSAGADRIFLSEPRSPIFIKKITEHLSAPVTNDYWKQSRLPLEEYLTDLTAQFKALGEAGLITLTQNLGGSL